MTSPVPVMQPLLPRADAVLPYLQRMDASGQYANGGPLVRELEGRYAQFLGVDGDCVVAVSSATLGITGAVAITGLRRWVVPDFSFPAPAHAVLTAGADLSLVDVSPNEWVVDADTGELEPGTGLLPVVPFGAPIDLDRWRSTADVVVDAAASLGSSGGRLAGLPPTWSVVFSLHATKVLPAGEGGLVVLGDAERARDLRRWANFGFWDTRISEIRGTNAKMTESVAAYALASLDAWPEEEQEWLAAQRIAHTAVEGIAGVKPSPGPVTANPFHVVRFDNPGTRDAAVRILDEDGIDSRRWWDALHAMPAFAGCAHGDVEVTEALAATTLGLPMFRGLSEMQGDRIRRSLQRAVSS